MKPAKTHVTKSRRTNGNSNPHDTFCFLKQVVGAASFAALLRPLTAKTNFCESHEDQIMNETDVLIPTSSFLRTKLTIQTDEAV